MLKARSWPATLKVTSWTSSPVVIRCDLPARPGRGSARGPRGGAPPPMPTAATRPAPPARRGGPAHWGQGAGQVQPLGRVAPLEHGGERQAVRLALDTDQEVAPTHRRCRGAACCAPTLTPTVTRAPRSPPRAPR